MKVREMAQMVIRLPDVDKQWLVRKAAEEERSQTWLVAKLVRAARENEAKQQNQAAA